MKAEAEMNSSATTSTRRLEVESITRSAEIANACVDMRQQYRKEQQKRYGI